jgi:hypothetical protein
MWIELRDDDDEEEVDLESILRRKQHSKTDYISDETWDVPATPGGAMGRGGLKDEEDGNDHDDGEDEDEDPFAQMDKEMEGTVAEGLFSDGIQAEHVVSLIKSLQPDSPDETILESCGILVFKRYQHSSSIYIHMWASVSS